MTPGMTWLLIFLSLPLFMVAGFAVTRLMDWVFPPRVDEIDWCAWMRHDEYERRVQR